MLPKIGDTVITMPPFRTEILKSTVTDISKIDESTYIRIVSSLYDGWVRASEILSVFTNQSSLLADEANTVIRHLDDLYK